MADQGRAGAGVIRDQARTVAAATAPLGNSAAGARLVVAAMDEHLAAMQRQLDTTTEQNKVLAARLWQLAEAYRGAGGGDGAAGCRWPGWVVWWPADGWWRRRRRAGRTQRACRTTSITDEPPCRWSPIGVQCRRTGA